MLLIVLIIGLIVIVIGFLWSIGRSSKFESTASLERSENRFDQEFQNRQFMYIDQIRRKTHNTMLFLSVFCFIVLLIPFFVSVYDTYSLKHVLDKERFDVRMRDSYILLLCMLGLALLFSFLIRFIQKKIYHNYLVVIQSLNKTDFDHMLDNFKHMSMLDRYFMMPPYIISESHLYVFKLGTVLVFPWTAITKVEIGAIRRGYYVIMTVDGRKYFFGVGERSMFQILQQELLQRSPHLELS